MAKKKAKKCKKVYCIISKGGRKGTCHKTKGAAKKARGSRKGSISKRCSKRK